jgi:membrane protein YqaA with SNARE-associated domain
MAFGFDDIFSGAGLSGAASGAVAGGAAGGGWGALAGGIAGWGLGAYANEKRQQATQQQKQNLDQIMANLRAMSQSSYAQHVDDLKKAQSAFGPAEQMWSRLYGTGQPAQQGQQDWSNTRL